MNKAQIAIQAAKTRPDTRKERESQAYVLSLLGVPMRLYILACQLEAAKKAGI